VAVLATLLAALWLGGLAEQRLMAAAGLDGNLKLVFARLARAGLMLLAVLISLPLVGIDLTALSVFGGALGVGIGFGLQKIAASYVSGFVLLLDRSIRLGNMITVDKYAGEVTRITTRYTVLRAPTGVEAIVPNEVLVGSVVMNETYTNSRVRHALALQVAYGTDLERAMALLVEAAQAQSRVLAEPAPQAFVVRFADSGIDLELGFWIDDPEAGVLGIKSDINLAIWQAFRREGIEIPYPQREVRLLNAP
jgi:small-conductance mechanosensitive channel